MSWAHLSALHQIFLSIKYVDFYVSLRQRMGRKGTWRKSTSHQVRYAWLNWNDDWQWNRISTLCSAQFIDPWPIIVIHVHPRRYYDFSTLKFRCKMYKFTLFSWSSWHLTVLFVAIWPGPARGGGRREARQPHRAALMRTGRQKGKNEEFFIIIFM